MFIIDLTLAIFVEDENLHSSSKHFGKKNKYTHFYEVPSVILGTYF